MSDFSGVRDGRVGVTAFDVLIKDVAARFGLGVRARPLVAEALALVDASHGGVAGLIERFRAAGLGAEAASWVGDPSAAPIGADAVGRALGEGAIAGIAQRLGLAPAAVSAAFAYVLPKLVGLLTPGATIPAGTPPVAAQFLAETAPAPASRPEASSAPLLRADVRASASAGTGIKSGPWLWPVIGAAALIALGAGFGRQLIKTPLAPSAPPPIAKPAPSPAPAAPPSPTAAAPSAPAAAPQSPPAVPAQASPAPGPAAAPSGSAAAGPPSSAASPPTTSAAAPAAPPPQASPAPAASAPPATRPIVHPAQLDIKNQDGTAHVTGTVRDDQVRTSALDALKAAFGPGKVVGDIAVDANTQGAPWLQNLRQALEISETGWRARGLRRRYCER